MMYNVFREKGRRENERRSTKRKRKKLEHINFFVCFVFFVYSYDG